MTEGDKLRALADMWMERPETTLAAAEFLLQGGFAAESLSRSCYAMFYAMTSLLVTRGMGSSKHKGALSLFSREFVKPGMVQKEMAARVNAAFRARLASDYSAMIGISADQAGLHLRDAEDFVAQSRALLARLLDERDRSDGSA